MRVVIPFGSPGVKRFAGLELSESKPELSARAKFRREGKTQAPGKHAENKVGFFG